jgi:hypothetical protein
MKKRSVATSHAPLFLGLLEMGLREQDRFRQAGTRPQAAFPLGEPTGHFAAKQKVSEWVIYFMEVYDRAPRPCVVYRHSAKTRRDGSNDNRTTRLRAKLARSSFFPRNPSKSIRNITVIERRPCHAKNRPLHCPQ